MSIAEVLNVTLGPVEFKSIQVDEDIGSSLGQTMQVFTNVMKRMHGNTEV